MRPILSVLNVLGALLMLFSGYYVLPLATALVYGEAESLRVFALCAGITLAAGGALVLATWRFRRELKPRDGYLLVVFPSPTRSSNRCRVFPPRAPP